MGLFKDIFGGGGKTTTTQTTSKTYQYDQRVMAEQTEVLAGPESTIAYPGSIVLGQDAAIGEVSFVTHQASAANPDALNNQLSSVLAHLMNQPQVLPSAAELALPKDKEDQKYLIYAAAGLAALFILPRML